MIVLYILGGISILLSLALLVGGIHLILEGDNYGFIFIYIGIIIGLAGVLMIFHKNSLTKQDVIDGKAFYQETQVITGNDTIKTYEILWKQKN